MNWQDRYRQARFRDASFFVDNSESDFGRRVAIHESPGIDTPFVQDIGKATREFSIEGYVLGADYLTQRDRLQLACEKEGPGELVHPYYGSLNVICKSIKFRDSSRERRIGRFTISFIECKQTAAIPVVDIDTVENLLLKRQSALQAVNSGFIKAYNIARKPYVLAQNAAETANSFLLQVESNRRVVGSVSDFVRTLNTTTQKIAEYLYKPQQLIDAIIELLSFGTTPDNPDFEATTGNSRYQFTEIRKTFDFVPVKNYGADDPALVMANAVQQASTVVCAGLLGVIEYDSLNDALTFRDIVLNKLDNLSSSGLDDSIYGSFQDLRKAVVADIDERATKLSRLASLKLQEATPALVVSNMLYGTTTQESSIIRRNLVKHPGFVPGGVDVEVLTYVNE